MCPHPARPPGALLCHLLILLLALTAWAGMASPAHAAALAVAPVRIDLSSQVRNTRIDVQNHGDHIMFVQVDAQAWTHNEHGDRFSPTEQLVFNPPLFRLAPGERQILRVGLRESAIARPVGDGPPPAERAFRLFLTEVSKASAGEDRITVNMRIGLPVFVRDAHAGGPPSTSVAITAPAEPSGAAKPGPEAPRLDWRLESDGRHLHLILENAGSHHVKIGDLVLDDGPGQPVRLKQGAYCLAGSVRRWRLPVGSGAATRTLKTEVDGRPYSASLRLATP